MKKSAGTVPYRVHDGVLQVLLVHMGGPFWAAKASMPGLFPKASTAMPRSRTRSPRGSSRKSSVHRCRPAPESYLGETRQSGTSVVAFARCANFDAARATSNTFEMEWPPRSGRMQSFPEVDRAEWFDLATARVKLVKGQVVFLDRLVALHDRAGPGETTA